MIKDQYVCISITKLKRMMAHIARREFCWIIENIYIISANNTYFDITS